MPLELDPTGELVDSLLPGLQDGSVHVVGYADPENGTVATLMSVAGLSAEERALFCERVNREEQAGLLWPIVKLSALPLRLVQAPLADRAALRRCLQEVFAAHRDFCKCPVVVFDLRGTEVGGREVAQEVEAALVEAGEGAPRAIIGWA